MENGNKSYGCDHENLFDFRPMSKTHFTADLVKKRNYPQKCAGCEKHFVNDAAELWPRGACAHACSNSYNHRDHKCVYTLCQDCYTKAAAKGCAAETSRRTRRKIVFPR